MSCLVWDGIEFHIDGAVKRNGLRADERNIQEMDCAASSAMERSVRDSTATALDDVKV